MPTIRSQQSRHARPLGWISACLCFFGIGLFLACAPETKNSGPTEIQQRLIPSDPRPLDRESLFEEKNAFEWSLGDPSEAAAWTGRNIDTTRADKQGLEIQTQSDDPQLVREVSFSAKSLHAIEIELTGLKKGRQLSSGLRKESLSPPSSASKFLRTKPPESHRHSALMSRSTPVGAEPSRGFASTPPVSLERQCASST